MIHHVCQPECDCERRLEHVGLIPCRELRRKVSLMRCPACATLIAVYRGVALWETPIPKAAVPEGVTS